MSHAHLAGVALEVRSYLLLELTASRLSAERSVFFALLELEEAVELLVVPVVDGERVASD